MDRLRFGASSVLFRSRLCPGNSETIGLVWLYSRLGRNSICILFGSGSVHGSMQTTQPWIGLSTRRQSLLHAQLSSSFRIVLRQTSSSPRTVLRWLWPASFLLFINYFLDEFGLVLRGMALSDPIQVLLGVDLILVWCGSGHAKFGLNSGLTRQVWYGSISSLVHV